MSITRNASRTANLTSGYLPTMILSPAQTPQLSSLKSWSTSAALAKSQLIEAKLGDITQSHGEIMEQLAMLQEQVERNLAPFCLFISTLAVNDISVLKPIPVTIEPEEGGSFVASFIDAGVSSGGDTLRDAVWSLQQMIASSFNTLFSMEDSKLGPKMLRKRDVLTEFLCRSQKSMPKTVQRS